MNVPKRAGSTNGKYPSEGKIASIEIRDGKIVDISSIPFSSRDVSFSVHSLVPTPVVNGQVVPLDSWSVERYNTGQFSSGEFLVPEDGKYTFSVSVNIATLSSDIPFGPFILRLRRIRVGGGDFVETQCGTGQSIDFSGAFSRQIDTRLLINLDLLLDAGDIIYADIINNSNTTYNILPGNESYFCGRAF